MIRKLYTKLNSYFRKKRYKKIRNLWKNEEVTILSNFCIGGIIYNTLGMKFCSPTINMCFNNDDFYHFVLHLPEYVNCALVESDDKTHKCPVGSLSPKGLKTIQLIFNHSSSFECAKNDWNKRKTRIQYDKILVIVGVNNTDLIYSDLYKKINYPKLCICTNENKKIDSTFYLTKYMNASKYPERSYVLGYSFLFGKRRFDFLPYVNAMENILNHK